MTNAVRLFRVGRLVSVLAVATLAACMSEMNRPFPSEPAAPEPTTYPPSFIPVVTSTRVTAQSQAASNRMKYRDSGVKPIKARKGAASIEARALLGSDGVALIDVTTGSFDGSTGTADIEKIQVKVLNTALSPINDKPASGEWSYTLHGLMPGDQLQIQANIKGGNVARTEVITVTIPVTRRPDLAVLGVDGAAQAHTNSSTVFYAPVAELNGDLGANANCVLLVNGTPVDQATGIWVDADGLVTCQFSYVFEAAGEYTVAIAAMNVVPGDWDLTNNSASRSITIVTPGTPIAYGQISVNDEAYTYEDTRVRTGDYPLQSVVGGAQMLSSVQVYATSLDPAPAPLQAVTVKVSTGATTIYQSNLNQLTAYEYTSGGVLVKCITYSLNGEQADSCTTPSGSGIGSWFSYVHSSGTVTYYGQTLYCNTYGCNTYTQNGENVTGWGQRYGLSAGSVVRVELAFVPAEGLSRTVDRSVTLQDYSGPVNYDVTSCAPYWDGLGQVCTRERSSGTVWRGTTTW